MDGPEVEPARGSPLTWWPWSVAPIVSRGVGSAAGLGPQRVRFSTWMTTDMGLDR